jgi:uncharacterized membrane protein YfcA
MLTVLLLGACVGLILGVTGAGGSIIAVPLLMAVLGMSLPEAAPLALLAVFIAAAVGALHAWRRRLVHLPSALPLAFAGMLVAPLGVLASRYLPSHVLTGLFALVLGALAARMLLQSRAGAVAELGTGAASASAPAARSKLLGIGIGTGFLSGLLGIGGGFLIVPALRKFTGLGMQRAVATSLVVIALVSAAGIGSAAVQQALVLDDVAVSFVAGSALGMTAGRRMTRRYSDATLQRLFALLLILASGRMALAAMA